MRRQYRCYTAHLAGLYLDIRGQARARPDLYAPDSYGASQQFGEAVRASGGAGILYDSVRHAGGVNVVAHRPGNVLDVVQADHFEITVRSGARRMDVRRLAASPTTAAAREAGHGEG